MGVFYFLLGCWGWKKKGRVEKWLFGEGWLDIVYFWKAGEVGKFRFFKVYLREVWSFWNIVFIWRGFRFVSLWRGWCVIFVRLGF